MNEYAGTAPNQANAPLHVNFVPLPDLVVTDVTAPAHVLVGQPFTATWTITNNGVGAVPDRQSLWQDYVYLSRDQFLDVRSDAFLGDFTRRGTLQAGGKYTVTANLTLPRNVTGPYYVF
ncbi:CARDB domain-containing protein, partial [Bradyrhizobium sp. NBAIM08]|uniref:CARDB domain-containing protein n=1 Tax=Bradyrhizobium sp. NBAIM08 TaxID=2793815 RepID=UPI001CD80F36